MEYTESQLNALMDAAGSDNPEAEYQLGCYFYEQYKKDRKTRKPLLDAVLWLGLAHKHGYTDARAVLKQIFDDKE